MANLMEIDHTAAPHTLPRRSHYPFAPAHPWVTTLALPNYSNRTPADLPLGYVGVTYRFTLVSEVMLGASRQEHSISAWEVGNMYKRQV